jgi:hypothetical protein
MQITLNIPDSMTAKVRGNDVTRDMTALPQVALDYLFAYGFQRANNDAGAVGKDESDEDAIAKSDKRWTSLANGVLRASAIREGDPVKAEAVKIATAAVVKALRKKGVKVSGKDGMSTADIRKLANDAIAANPSIMETAKARVAITVGELEIDV